MNNLRLNTLGVRLVINFLRLKRGKRLLQLAIVIFHYIKITYGLLLVVNKLAYFIQRTKETIGKFIIHPLCREKL